jgi:hypothetical protein
LLFCLNGEFQVDVAPVAQIRSENQIRWTLSGVSRPGKQATTTSWRNQPLLIYESCFFGDWTLACISTMSNAEAATSPYSLPPLSENFSSKFARSGFTVSLLYFFPASHPKTMTMVKNRPFFPSDLKAGIWPARRPPHVNPILTLICGGKWPLMAVSVGARVATTKVALCPGIGSRT